MNTSSCFNGRINGCRVFKNIKNDERKDVGNIMVAYTLMSHDDGYGPPEPGTVEWQ